MKLVGKGHRARDLVELAIGWAILVLVLFIVSFFTLRLDLTTEGRFTLTEPTKELFRGSDDVVFVRVYLEGELPADLGRLRQSTKELLDEIRAYAPDKLDYVFVDPSEDGDEKARAQIYDDLQQQGLQYTSLRIREKDGASEKIVFPGALVTYQGRTLPLQLLKTQLRTPDAEMVNRSVNNLEYEFANTVRQLTRKERPRVAFLEGHGELDELQVKDISTLLSEQYDLSRVRIDGQLAALSERQEGMRYRSNRYDALIVAKPDSAFSDKDRFVIDQFIMNGGRVLWLLDAMNAHLDSLREKQFSIATPLELGLEDLLFAYGVRINNDLVLDRSCAPIEIYTQPYGNQRKLERFNWYFEPVLVSDGSHPIVTNLDPIHTRFVSTMDTIGTDSVTKTILLTTSPYIRVMRNPVRIGLGIVELDLSMDPKGTPAPLAILLEGKFRSAFTDRISPRFAEEDEIGYRERGRRSAQIVISDGDVIANRTDREKGMYYMLGYDRYAGTKIYGNRELIANAMNYLLDDQSLISVRSRHIALRKSDPERIVQERTRWQVVGLSVPAGASILLGLLFHFWRKGRYSKRVTKNRQGP
ncbi:MAG: gliding motility-associated ABC transporter substrate-binding protein GldG [Flavobacteriales bacterium]|nr:gliding motility-associated ABC transporter substrate-binding protein GldG [Flavobacteriales bacterium]